MQLPNFIPLAHLVMDKFKKGEYAGCYYQRRVLTPSYRLTTFSNLDSTLRKSDQFLKKNQYLEESFKTFSSDYKRLSPTHLSYSKASKDYRTEKSVNLTNLISTLMTKYLGIKEKDEQSVPGMQDKFKYFELKKKKRRLQEKKAENSVLIFNPDYYKKEFIGYFNDVGRTVEMEKYIGQNLLKKRKQITFLNRLGRV